MNLSGQRHFINRRGRSSASFSDDVDLGLKIVSPLPSFTAVQSYGVAPPWRVMLDAWRSA